MAKLRPAAGAGSPQRATKARWTAAQKAQARKGKKKMTAREERRAAQRDAELQADSGPGTRSSGGYRQDGRTRPGRTQGREYSSRERDDRPGRFDRQGDNDRRDQREERSGRSDYRSGGQESGRGTGSYRDQNRHSAGARGDYRGSDRRGYDRDGDQRRWERPARDDRFESGSQRTRYGAGEGDRRGQRNFRGQSDERSWDRSAPGQDRRGGGQRPWSNDRNAGGQRQERGYGRYDRERRDSFDERGSGGQRGGYRSRDWQDRDRDQRRDSRGYDGQGERSQRSYEDRPRRGFEQGRRTDAGQWSNERHGSGRSQDFERRPRRESDGYRDAGERKFGGERRYERRPSVDPGAGEGARPDFQAERMRRTERPRRVELPEDPNDGFEGLGVPMPIVERLARDGIAEPFPIQKATIPDAIAGRDVLGRGRTGSGKTMAFGIPVLTRLAGASSRPKHPRALILSPTRELAMQIGDALAPLARVMGLKHKLVAGGMPYEPQIDALDRGVDILIATPGRLHDLIEKGAALLNEVQIVVLDEADLMADMGFMPEVSALLELVPPDGQRLLFSATLDKGVDALVEKYLTDPVEHSTDEAKASIATMTHHIFLLDPAHKKPITGDIANRAGRTVVFVRTKLGADRVASQLRDQGVFAAALHGGLNQGVRNRILAAFRDGTLPVLVATDVASRGIHVDDVSAVLQVDPPKDHKDYLHRAGRTARAGSEGVVVTLALPHQRKLMKRIATDAGLDVEPVRVRIGDDSVIAATGAARPSGVPVPEERLRAILEPPRRPARRPGGGGRGRGGFDRRRPRRFDDRGQGRG